MPSLGILAMATPIYLFSLEAMRPIGTLEIKGKGDTTIRMIFDYYLSGASLCKVVDMLYKKPISPPSGKAKWTHAAVYHLLSNPKYIVVVGFESFTDVQFETFTHCNVDYNQADPTVD